MDSAVVVNGRPRQIPCPCTSGCPAGEMVAMMTVLQRPPRASCRRRVLRVQTSEKEPGQPKKAADNGSNKKGLEKKRQII